MPSRRLTLVLGVCMLTAAALVLALPRGQAAHISPGVMATIPVGTNPLGVAVNPTTNRIYVTNFAANSVSVIDGAANAEIDTDGNPANGMTRIPVGAAPKYVGVNPATNKIYVANGSSNNVSVINGATNAVVATISTLPAQDLQQVGVNPNTNKIYVASNDPGGRVVKIDGSTDMIETFISVAANPRPVGVNPATNKIYVGHGSFFGRTRITSIDGASNAVSDCTDVGLDHSSIAVNPMTDRIYLTRNGFDDVKVFDGACNPVIATVPVGDGPSGIGVNPSTSRIYVTNQIGNTVSVVDGASNTVVATIPVGTVPVSAGVNPSTDRVYVANIGSNTISVIADPFAPATATPTATSTPTNTPTDTPTNTPTNTPTDTPTNTPTDTPTDTPTNTPTDTPTDTPTNTPTDTPTPTPCPDFDGDTVCDYIDADDDNDGCTDTAELQTAPGSEETGGRRNPTYYWDFYDVWTRPFGNLTGWERDKEIDLFGDIFGVVARFGAERPGGQPSKAEALAEALTPPAPADETGYHAAYDRSPPAPGGDPWDMGPADGTIELFTDIIGVALQFGHDCT